MRCKCIRFSPSNDSFCCCTTEGLIIYSIDDMMLFNPIDLDINITVDTIQNTIKEGNINKALLMSLCLNEKEYIIKCIEKCNIGEVSLVIKTIPPEYLYRILEVLVQELESSRHIEYYLYWCLNILQIDGEVIHKNIKSYLGIIRSLYKIISEHRNELLKLVESNVYTLDYLCNSKEGIDENNEEEKVKRSHDEMENNNIEEDVDNGDDDIGDKWYGPE